MTGHRLSVRPLRNLTSLVGALGVAAGVVLYARGMIGAAPAAHLIYVGLVSITGREALRKVMLLLAALGDEAQSVDVADGTATVRRREKR